MGMSNSRATSLSKAPRCRVTHCRWRPDDVPEKRPSEWPALFDLAIDILKHFNEANGFSPSWSFGGGTALMLQIDHRESHDIDLFLDDPQYLPFLKPETRSEEHTSELKALMSISYAVFCLKKKKETQ